MTAKALLALALLIAVSAWIAGADGRLLKDLTSALRATLYCGGDA